MGKIFQTDDPTITTEQETNHELTPSGLNLPCLDLAFEKDVTAWLLFR